MTDADIGTEMIGSLARSVKFLQWIVGGAASLLVLVFLAAIPWAWAIQTTLVELSARIDAQKAIAEATIQNTTAIANLRVDVARLESKSDRGGQ